MLIKHHNIEAIVSELQKENDLLRNDVLDLRNRSKQISDKIDLEQYGRRDCVKIRGVQSHHELILDITRQGDLHACL